MKILLGCEETQKVCKEFRALGHEAYSCDILPCSGGHPEWHFQSDVRIFLMPQWKWDMLIAFPPCTHLAVSGSKYFAQKREDGRQREAISFFMMFANSNIPKIAIENPVGIMSTQWRKPNQIIQPYHFGEDASKATCLWLKGLPRLNGTKYIAPRIVDGKKRWANQTDSGQDKSPPSDHRAKDRSVTYSGIAKAMAQQWGNL